MTAAGQDFTMYAGDDKTLRFSLQDESGEPLDLTDVSLEWVLRDGGQIVLSKTIGNGITVVSESGGVFDVLLAPADTESLPAKQYQHGAVISVEEGQYDTISVGTLTILPMLRSATPAGSEDVEPVTLSEAKLYCKVDGDEDDELIASLITAARQQAEEYTRRSFVTQTLELSLDLEDLFEHPYIELPRSPVQSIESINSYDGDDQESVVSSSSYRLSGDRVVLTSGGTWPSNLRDRDCIVVRYVAGYGAASAVPEAIKTAIKAMVAHAYDNRAQVSIDAGLPYLHPYKVYRL